MHQNAAAGATTGACTIAPILSIELQHQIIADILTTASAARDEKYPQYVHTFLLTSRSYHPVVHALVWSHQNDAETSLETAQCQLDRVYGKDKPGDQLAWRFNDNRVCEQVGTPLQFEDADDMEAWVSVVERAAGMIVRVEGVLGGENTHGARESGVQRSWGAQAEGTYETFLGWEDP